MSSTVKSLGKNRLGIFADPYSEDSFILRNSEIVFARINKIGSRWVVWFYTKHLQKTFEKLREAISYTNEQFIDYYLESVA